MLTISHALIGASIATRIANPIISLPIAIVIHFICDLIPHWDVGVDRRARSTKETFVLAAIDVILAIILMFAFFSSKVPTTYLLSMFFASTLPDWLEAPYLFLNWNFFPFESIYRFQSKLQQKLQLPLGLITQALVVFLVYYLSTAI